MTNEVNEVVKHVDLEDVLVKFNLFGRYHSWTLLLILLPNIYTGIACLNYVFAVEPIEYRCKDDINATCGSNSCSEWIYDNPNSLVAEFQLACEEWKRTLIGSSHNVGYMAGLCIVGPISDRLGRKASIVITSVLSAMMGLAKSFTTSYWLYVSFEFLEAMIGCTFSPVYLFEFQLACEEWKRTLIGSSHNVGYMAGLCIVGPISDRLGRKASIVITSVLSAMMGLAKSFTTSYWLYVSFEFLEAMIGCTFSPVYLFAVEIVATKKRISYITICNLGWYIGAVFVAVIGWLFQYWRSYLQAIYGPPLLLIFYLYLMDESPRWLLTKGRKEEAAAIIKKAARMNKMTIDNKVLDNLSAQEEYSLKFVELLKSTFASRTILKRFIICFFWWTASAFVNYGIIINSVSLQGNKYLNFGILSFIDIPGTLLYIFVLKYFKRKYSLMLTFLIGAILCLIQPLVPTDLRWLSVTLYMTGKVMSTLYFDTTYLFTSELFPTYTRNSMHGLCSGLGRIGSIAAPMTPLLVVYWSGLPSLIFGCVALFASFLTIFVPDTSDYSLPDTVKQAEALGIKPKLEDGEDATSFGASKVPVETIY